MANGELGAADTGASLAAGGVKLAYQRPSLSVYGSVRELTGASSIGKKSDGNKAMSSDPALKENAVRIGTHPAGFGIYLFDYKAEHRAAHGHGRQFGVMANEVEMVLPEAVMVRADGYRAVNYSMLGITHH
jgi:hypothetical protein